MSDNDSCLRLHQTLKFTVLGGKNENHQISLPVRNDVVQEERRPTSEAKLSIFLDINEAYTRETIIKALRSRAPHSSITLGPGEGDEEVQLPQGCDFQWSEYERIDWSAVLAGKHGASSYCVRKGISRKAQLAHYTHLYCCKNPDSMLKEHIPKTLILDTWPVWDDDCRGDGGLADIVVSASGGVDNVNRRERLDKCLGEAKQAMIIADKEYEEESKKSKKADPPVWILKPSTVNKGAGIKIVHLYEEVVDLCWSESDIREWVLQRYIDPPLLLRKRKFHIRAYVLAVSALKVYFYRKCLALCSARRYRRHDTSNMFSHLTNTAFQDLDPDFDEEDNVRLWDDDDAATMLFQDGTCKTLEEASQRVLDVIRQMELITGELFQAYKNEFGVFAPIERCFEHFGFDFMVGRDWKVYLLEVNPGPDFKQTGPRLSGVIECLMSDTIDATLLAEEEDGSKEQAGHMALVYSEDTRSSKNRSGGSGMTLM